MRANLFKRHHHLPYSTVGREQQHSRTQFTSFLGHCFVYLCCSCSQRLSHSLIVCSTFPYYLLHRSLCLISIQRNKNMLMAFGGFNLFAARIYELYVFNSIKRAAVFFSHAFFFDFFTLLSLLLSEFCHCEKLCSVSYALVQTNFCKRTFVRIFFWRFVSFIRKCSVNWYWERTEF